MKHRFILFRRAGVFYSEDATTRQQHSLHTKNKAEALTLLHSYRYAWAERARTCGYPERLTQEALGPNSKAVHRVYAIKAQVVIPTLEDYERKLAADSPDVVVQMPAVVNQ
jgi:hypothetical protein